MEKTNEFSFIYFGKTKYINNGALTSFNFDSEESMLKEIEKIYENDKQDYLEKGKWPNTRFLYRNNIWAYYFYLQLNDKDINLDKYLDFDYNTEEWSRERLLELVNKYGRNILFTFCCYSNSGFDLDKDFDEWYEEDRMPYENLTLSRTDGTLPDYLEELYKLSCERIGDTIIVAGDFVNYDQPKKK